MYVRNEKKKKLQLVTTRYFTFEKGLRLTNDYKLG